MGLYIGSTAVTGVYKGSTAQSAVYYGSTQVRPSGWQPGADTSGYWKFDGDTKDYSGNNHDWTMSGTPTYDTLTSGKKTLKFSGDDYGQITGYALPMFVNGGKGPFTVSMYIGNTTSRTSTYNSVGILIPKRNDNGILYWTATRSSNPQKIYYCMGFASDSSTIINAMPTQFPYTGYFHYVITMDSSYIQNIYMNGVLVATVTGTGGQAHSSGMWLGCDNNGGTSSQARRFIGNLSELIVEDKIWTATEISNYYDQTKGDYGIS